MIALIQRVDRGKVVISNQTISEIEHGYVILLGIFKKDSDKDVIKLIDKVVNLRIMSDENGKMNKSIIETGGQILVVSQFTLAADLTGGRRPSFINAMEPIEAEKIYNLFVKGLREKEIDVKTGKFGEYMQVQILNNGPVTILADSKKI